jgi:site-specific recombinase XerD
MRKPLSVPAAIDFYLTSRRRLGFALIQEGWLLGTLARHAREGHHRGPLTAELVLRWAQLPQPADPLWWARRLAIARQFAQFWVAFDPRTQVPPAGVFGPSHRRKPVHIYTEAETAALLGATANLGPANGMRVATFKTLFGLLACTGLRISEALKLRPEDFDATGQTLLIQPCKFSPARRLPLQCSASAALSQYHQFCQQTLAQATRPAFFLNAQGWPLTRGCAEEVFARLRAQLGWTQDPVPRLHDLRHTFAVRCLVDWNRQTGAVDAKILALAAYLGHRRVADTYWYLSAIPQLLASSAARFEQLAASTPEDQRHA